MLVDVSGSMAEHLGRRLKIDHVRTALGKIWPTIESKVIIAFGSVVHAPLFNPRKIPEPSGKTALHLALEAAAAHAPSRVVLVTDGYPDDPEAAMEAAKRLPCAVDVLFVSDEWIGRAIEFLTRLAAMTGGSFSRHDLRDPESFSRELAMHVGPRTDDRTAGARPGPETRAKIDRRARLLVAVRRAYRDAAVANHPDKGGDLRAMAVINTMREDLVRTIERRSGLTKAAAVEAVGDIYFRLNAAQPPLTEFQVGALARFKTHLVAAINRRAPRKETEEAAP